MTVGRKLTIIQINDVHGYLEPHPEVLWDNGIARCEILGGYARLAGLLQAVRSEQNDAVCVFDNGDTFHGTYPVVKTKGEALVPLLNALSIDAMTGHWDFAYGPRHLQELVAKLSFPFLAINCFNEADGKLTFPPTMLFERGGIRVGVIGIAATIVDKTMPPHFSEGIWLSLGDKELPGHIRRLREEGAEVIIVVSHLGFPQDAKLASEVNGIDILLSGHTHNRLYEPVYVNGAAIIQSGCHGSFAGRLDLEVQESGVKVVRHTLIPLDASVPQDGNMQRMIDEVLEPHRSMLEEVVGHTDVLLHRNNMLETLMDNVLLAAVAEAAGTRLAFSNGWRYGAPIPPGPITMNDLWNIMPTNPPVSIVEITGAELTAMMEENLERTFAANPYHQMGGFVKRCFGINLYAKLENPAGHRIDRLFVAGDPIEADRTYVAAYVTAQGIPAKFGRNRRNLDMTAIEAMRRYAAAHDVIAPALMASVVAV